jgi:hypothetical protein
LSEVTLKLPDGKKESKFLYADSSFLQGAIHQKSLQTAVADLKLKTRCNQKSCDGFHWNAWIML